MLDLEINPDFEALPEGGALHPLPDKVVKSLSTDAYVCYKYVEAIKAGIQPPELAQLKPGPIVHSRWLTTGKDFLFMWTRKHGFVGDNLKNLKTLVEFCIKSYFKMFLTSR